MGVTGGSWSGGPIRIIADYYTFANGPGVPDEDGTIRFESNKLQVYKDGAWTDIQTGTDLGEANTASNTGSAGTGIFKQKTGVDLELYKLNSTNSFLTIALDGTDKIDFTVSSSALDTDYLRLDATNDPVTGQLDISNNIVPTTAAAYDLGDSTNFWRTLYLENDGGNVALCKGVVSGGGPTNYTFNCGGGQFGSDQNQGGTFTFEMNNIGGSQGTSINQMIFDLGQVDFAASVTNDMIFQSFNGISTYAFVSSFGGFNNPEYGFELRRTSGSEISSKTLVFDNQVPVSDFRRSIDFRINSTNVLTMENETSLGAGDYTVDFPVGEITSPGLLSVTAPTGLQVNGYGALTSSTVFNLLDVFTVKATTPNVPVTLGMRPDGTNTSSLIFVTNSQDTTNYGVLEASVNGTTAQMVTWRINSGTGPTVLNIGEKVSNFLGVGTADSLTTIDIYFANAIEMQIQPNTMIFNNGATDTQIDWGTNGELGLQVATNDILRLTASQIQASQDITLPDSTFTYYGTGLDMSIDYNGTIGRIQTDLVAASDLQIDCGTDKTVELVETVWKDINVGGVALRSGAANQPSLVNFDTTTILVYQFSPTQTNELHGNFEIQHDYKEETDLSAHLHWYPTNTDTGNVVWGLEYTIEENTGTVVSGTLTVTTAASGTAWQAQIASLGTITGTGISIGAQMHFRLFRDGGNAADTYNTDAAIATFGIHYEIDTLGSRQLFTK